VADATAARLTVSRLPGITAACPACYRGRMARIDLGRRSGSVPLLDVDDLVARTGQTEWLDRFMERLPRAQVRPPGDWRPAAGAVRRPTIRHGRR
jgi:hypothetical protein